MELIEVRPDPAIKGNNCAVEIEMADGKKLTSFCEHPRGSFENPLTRAQIESQVPHLRQGRDLPDAQAEEVIAAVNRLEDLASVRKLMDLLRGATQKAQAA